MRKKREGKLTDSQLIGQTAGDVLHWLNLHRPAEEKLTVDRLLTNPRIAIELCQQTSKRLHRQLQHEQILTSLLNARKRGDLKP